MKVLVLGSAGMAGHIISLYLTEVGYEVVGFSRKKNQYVDGVLGNAEDTTRLKEIIDNGNFDYVINCIGILNQFAENNPAKAVFINSYLPHFLAEITADSKTKILHMSTDCVFSGDKGNYKKDDLKDGKTFYDRSKALGELDDNKNITLRNSIVGPDINENGIGLLNWFMKQEDEINGFTKAIWSGQTTLQLAKTMDAVMKNNVCGLYNAVPKESISKYELLKLFNHYLKNDKLKINPVEGVNLNKSLVSTPFEFEYTIPNYDTMVREMSEWIHGHKELYKHYGL